MGYQTVGIEGLVTSWGTAGADVYQLINAGIAPFKFSIQVSSDVLDVTAFAAGLTSKANRAGLATWSGTITGRYPQATKKLGNSGSVTFAGGYAQHVRSWELELAADALDITEMSGSAVTWRAFRPGLIGWSGSYEARVDSATAVNLPTLASGSSGAATFKISEEGTTDNAFAGNIIVPELGVDVEVSALNTARYSFTGDGTLSNTYASTLGLLSASASPYTVTTPSWDTNGDGTPDVSLVLQAASGRTFTGPAFWKSLRVSCPVDGLIEVSVGVQGAGALVLA